MKVFMFAPVLRSGSYNKKLIRIARDILNELPDIQASVHEFNEFPMPVYDGDLEDQQGIPQGVLDLAKKITEADAIVISTPEYNGGIPGPFKNAIDWVSRLHPVPLEGKQVCLLGASQSYFAGVRNFTHSQAPLVRLRAFVYPDYFGLAFAHKAFDEKDQLKDPQDKERLRTILHQFIHYASRKETPFDRLAEFFDEQKNQFHSPH